MKWSRRTTYRVGLDDLGPTDLVIFWYLGLGFALAGGAALAGSVWMDSSTRKFVAGAVTATGEVTALVRRESREGVTYAPTVRFRTARGQVVEFTATTSSRPPEYAVGDRVGVLYDPARPAGATINGFFALWGAAVILGLLGLPFAAAGGILLAIAFRVRAAAAARARLRAELQGLRRHGRRVAAKVLEVRPGPPGFYRVASQWYDPAAGRVYVFESDPIGYDPSEFLAGTVPVFIDPQDPRRYLVDTSSLPAPGNAPGSPE
jgi:hypothetical protein